ncbi:LOW QUALITY PROTEIN: putative protein phosphatase 1N [Glossophaga mutica]
MQLGGRWSPPDPRVEGWRPLPACWGSPLFSSQGRRAGERARGRGPRARDRSWFLRDARQCAQRPHGGEAASWALRFGASAAQGWRAHMEDAHCAWLALPWVPPGWAFFFFFFFSPVLDGQGKARAALFGASHLPGPVLALGPAADESKGLCRTLRSAFLSADARLRSLWPRGDPGASAAVGWPVSSRFLYLAHCGDFPAVPSRTGAVVFSTEDHRPLQPQERERIQDVKGTICLRSLEGSLAVSRALGNYKEAPGGPPELQLVSAEPEVTALAPRAEDEFMLLVYGVWDAMFGATLAAMVTSRLCLGLASELLCLQLLDTFLCEGSLDNMTCILVCFPGETRPCEEVIRKEVALDEALGRQTLEAQAGFSAQESPSRNTVFRTVASENILDLPPGAGLYCK